MELSSSFPLDAFALKNFTRVYLNTFSEDIDDEKVREMKEVYGKIISAKVMTTEDGRGRGFGFVSFEDHEAAAKVNSLN